jgi:hypothetical protein
MGLKSVICGEKMGGWQRLLQARLTPEEGVPARRSRSHLLAVEWGACHCRRHMGALGQRGTRFHHMPAAQRQVRTRMKGWERHVQLHGELSTYGPGGETGHEKEMCAASNCARARGGAPRGHIHKGGGRLAAPPALVATVCDLERGK